MKLHLCVGGPLNGLMADQTDVRLQGYTQYNSAGCAHRSKASMRRAIDQGHVIRPSMVFIHYSVFTKVSEALYDAL